MIVFTLDLKKEGVTEDLTGEGREFHSLMVVEVEKEWDLQIRDW